MAIVILQRERNLPLQVGRLLERRRVQGQRRLLARLECVRAHFQRWPALMIASLQTTTSARLAMPARLLALVTAPVSPPLGELCSVTGAFTSPILTRFHTARRTALGSSSSSSRATGASSFHELPFVSPLMFYLLSYTSDACPAATYPDNSTFEQNPRNPALTFLS